jgi:hypothetical protein
MTAFVGCGPNLGTPHAEAECRGLAARASRPPTRVCPAAPDQLAVPAQERRRTYRQTRPGAPRQRPGERRRIPDRRVEPVRAGPAGAGEGMKLPTHELTPLPSTNRVSEPHALGLLLMSSTSSEAKAQPHEREGWSHSGAPRAQRTATVQTPRGPKTHDPAKSLPVTARRVVGRARSCRTRYRR